MNFGIILLAATMTFSNPVSDRGIDMSMKLEPGSRIAVVSKNVNGEFWERIKAGMEQALSDVNDAYELQKDNKIIMTFEGPTDETDVDTQINTLDAVIAENPAVVCLSASDMDSCLAQMEAAKENGIPVVVFDSNVSNTEMIAAYRSSDNIKIGQIAADKMMEALPQGGKVAIFAVQEKTQTARDRVDSFVAELDSEHYEILDVIYQDQVEDIASAIENVLDENPDLDGVFCENDESAIAYLDTVSADREKLPLMIGVDGTSPQIQALQEGREYGIVSQNPYEMGYQTMLTAISLSGEDEVELERSVLLEPAWLDLSNLDDPACKPYIY